MIKAEELRVGNIVRVYSGMHTIAGVNSKEYESYTTKEDSNIKIVNMKGDTFADVTESAVCPVPITHDRLSNLGFEKKTTKGFEDIDVSFIYKNIPGLMHIQWENEYYTLEHIVLETETENRSHYHFTRRVTYMHELQNLVYALTGYNLAFMNTSSSATRKIEK